MKGKKAAERSRTALTVGLGNCTPQPARLVILRRPRLFLDIFLRGEIGGNLDRDSRFGR